MKKAIKLTKPEVGNRQEIAQPDLLSVSTQEGYPCLTCAASWSALPQIFLDSTFADTDA